MKPLTWTDIKPSRGGLYWMEVDDIGRIVKVDSIGGRLHVIHFQGNSWILIEPIKARWAGPIPYPEEQ